MTSSRRDCSTVMGSHPQKTPILEAWIGVFKPNSQNAKTCILSKLPRRFQPNFAVIKTTKCPSWAIKTRASQIQDGGRQHCWKNRKITISQQRFDRSVRSPRNLVTWRSFTLLALPTVKNSKFSKFRMAAGAILTKNLKIIILHFLFWATVCKTVLPMLRDRCLSVCDVGVLW